MKMGGKNMQYQNPFWGMMNYDYIQQQAQQYHMGQGELFTRDNGAD